MNHESFNYFGIDLLNKVLAKAKMNIGTKNNLHPKISKTHIAASSILLWRAFKFDALILKVFGCSLANIANFKELDLWLG